jgi:two-component system chemotaxis sensor kinase CheA
MQIEDDEILQGFIEESLEHLADIETDLLAIEKAGANIDENLVNKVFRAAHSIKGGAGFMGLTVIQELSHAMENILGMIRSRKLVPNPEIVNVLLQGSDKLESMINNIQSSNDEDITEHLIPLNAIAEGNALQAPTPKPEPSAQPAPEPVIESVPEPVAQEVAASPAPMPAATAAPVVQPQQAHLRLSPRPQNLSKQRRFKQRQRPRHHPRSRPTPAFGSMSVCLIHS